MIPLSVAGKNIMDLGTTLFMYFRKSLFSCDEEPGSGKLIKNGLNYLPVQSLVLYDLCL